MRPLPRIPTRSDREHAIGQFAPKERDPSDLLIVGWQELAALPELGLDAIRAKLDTGAFLSSLHVDHVRVFRKLGSEWVRFGVGTVFGLAATEISCEAPVTGFRRIQSSDGHRSIRPVIETMLNMAGYHWSIELTLSSRTTMQFPLLIGRDALAGRCLVDSGRTYLVSTRYS